MAENKNSFVLYSDIYATVKKLPKDKIGDLFLTILSYVNDENPVVEDMMVDLVFEPIKLQLKRDLAKWATKKDTKSENGALGNLKRWNNDLYLQVLSSEITLETAMIIAKDRKVSLPDKDVSPGIANVAVNVNGTVNATVTVNKRAKALVVAGATPGVTKRDYENVIEEVSGKDKNTIVTALKDCLSKRPEFLEPYCDYWNVAVEGTQLPTVKTMSEARLKKLKTRIREPAFDFIGIIKKIYISKKIRYDSQWFSFDWVFENETNYIKILEGNYDN